MTERAHHSLDPDQEWRLQARCRGMPIEVFFLASTEKGSLRTAHEANAKRICLSCNVRRRCLTYAMEISEQHGVWGATTPAERNAMRKRAVS
ncbi:WhiB family transcriptional regulator [Mycobacterium sp. shizuoka-1]|uniref:WhiB family transcriptional regulator n=1 Tax=Mycobacterium sp. shizuoka-1 TaxID=2039281 RepID=UPI000C061520|nr:WhiB family transcriptional regulator [Mycobacterium sp. shizuoka-1]GAY13665.1 transcriptional regulator WhiB [Mycobacterium sp. shizuoka-1]